MKSDLFHLKISKKIGIIIKCWGRSSIGRASDLHSEGREFDSLRLHQALINGCVAQLARAIDSYSIGRGFESPRSYQITPEKGVFY